MGGSMGCNMDSTITAMNMMSHLTTYKMDSIMDQFIQGCPAMGPMSGTMQDYYQKMQALRKAHLALHLR